MPVKLDMYERKILELLQSDASLSTAAIAEKVGLSPSPCWRRIDRLEKDGFIKCKVAIVDRHKVGFAAAIRNVPEVLECFVLMGNVDFLVRIVAEDIEAYERIFFQKLSQLPGVQEVNSTVALSEIKSTTQLPIPPAN